MILVIGYGNTLRRDDGAGVRLAERLAGGSLRFSVRVETAHQLAPEMAPTIAEPDVEAIVFVDASAAVDEVMLSRIEPVELSPALGHHLTPPVLMVYADRLYGRTPPAWLMSLPASDFEHGEMLSESCEAGVDCGYMRLCGLIEDVRGDSEANRAF